MNNKRNVRVKRVFFIVCLNLLSKKFGTIQPDIRPKEDKNYEYRSNVFQNRFLKCGPYNSLQSIRITMGITKKILLTLFNTSENSNARREQQFPSELSPHPFNKWFSVFMSLSFEFSSYSSFQVTWNLMVLKFVHNGFWHIKIVVGF